MFKHQICYIYVKLSWIKQTFMQDQVSQQLHFLAKQLMLFVRPSTIRNNIFQGFGYNIESENNLQYGTLVSQYKTAQKATNYRFTLDIV